MECKYPDGLSKYHCKYWQLCPVPCLTPLIHLPLPLSFPIPGLFQSMLLFFRSFFICLFDAASLSPPPHPSPHPPPPSVSLSRVTPMDRCLYLRLLLCLWTRVRPGFDGLGQWDINMHGEPYAGGRDGPFPLQKKSPCITQRQRTQAAVFTGSAATGNHWPATDRNSNLRHF